MIVISGTKELLEMYYGEPQKETIKSIVVMDEDKPVGVAGWRVVENKAIAFMDLSKELREHKSFKRIVVRGLREWMKIKPKRLPMYTKADKRFDKAESFLIRLGFEHYNGDVWLIR